VDWVRGSVLHGGRCAACCEVLTNIADESASPMADNIWNEVVNNSQITGVENAVFSHVDIFRS
jgi:hypothetical protein